VFQLDYICINEDNIFIIYINENKKHCFARELNYIDTKRDNVYSVHDCFVGNTCSEFNVEQIEVRDGSVC